MKIISGVLLAPLLGLTALNSALAGPEPMTDYSKGKEAVMEQQVEHECNWYISLGGGADFDFGSTEWNRGRNVSTFFGLVRVDNFRAHEFNDVFDTPFHIQGELGYAISQYVELFGKFKYSAADGGTTSGGRVAYFGSETDFRNEWDDYTSYGGQVGVRFFFLNKAARFRPYISLSGGATRVDSIDLKMRVTSTTTNAFTPGELLFDGAFYGGSTVATGTALAGFEVGITRCFSIGADAGVTYESKLADDDTDLNDFNIRGFSFSNTNFHKLNDNAGDRLYCPVTAYVKLRF